MNTPSKFRAWLNYFLRCMWRAHDPKPQSFSDPGVDAHAITYDICERCGHVGG